MKKTKPGQTQKSFLQLVRAAFPGFILVVGAIVLGHACADVSAERLTDRPAESVEETATP